MIGSGIGIAPMGGSSSGGSNSTASQQIVSLKGQITQVLNLTGILLKC